MSIPLAEMWNGMWSFKYKYLLIDHIVDSILIERVIEMRKNAWHVATNKIIPLELEAAPLEQNVGVDWMDGYPLDCYDY